MLPISLTQVAVLDVSAPSGVVAREDGLWVVADDERFVTRYSYAGVRLARHRIWQGELPESYAARKLAKPDLEALTQLDEVRLLALPSGSTPARMNAACISPMRDGSSRVETIDARPLYEALARTFPELNIEGAAVHGGRLWLAQRGNGALGQNACIELDLARVIAGIKAARALHEHTLIAIHTLQLGELGGVPLAVTDLTAHPDHGLLFCAAAEAGRSTYDDGACAGSAIGALDEGRSVRWVVPVDQPYKLEGLACRQESSPALDLWLVVDPDDRTQSAPLLRTCLSPETGAVET